PLSPALSPPGECGEAEEREEEQRIVEVSPVLRRYPWIDGVDLAELAQRGRAGQETAALLPDGEQEHVRHEEKPDIEGADEQQLACCDNGRLDQDVGEQDVSSADGQRKRHGGEHGNGQARSHPKGGGILLKEQD